MSIVSIKHKGSFRNIDRFLVKANKREYFGVLKKYAIKGVEALSSATPIDTGYTSQCWKYEIETTEGKTIIRWLNTNAKDGVNIALILQYGHGTGTGGYVQGLDYINPALQPVFDEIAEQTWKEVTSI